MDKEKGGTRALEHEGEKGEKKKPFSLRKDSGN